MTGHRDGVHRDPIDPLPGRGDRRERTARAAVLEHATGEHRRHFPTLVHVGAPLGRATVVPAGHGGDHALRTDVLGALTAEDAPPADGRDAATAALLARARAARDRPV